MGIGIKENIYQVLDEKGRLTTQIIQEANEEEEKPDLEHMAKSITAVKP
jgi:hypothetical protein